MLQGGIEATDKGQVGSRYMADTTVYTGNWGKITCITDCAFTTLTSGFRGDGTTRLMLGTLTMSLKAGTSIYGHFVAITLASGSVIAYEGVV